jgi:hypothetical protein
LKALTALAAFDGALLQPGAEFSTHELVVRMGASLQQLLEWHAEAVASLYQVPPPPVRKPVVFCSWYFYGKDIREEDVEENLKSLREKPVPFDVFQIDHGWLDKFGDWNANEKFPSGLDHLARMIRNAGHTPGIWTAPFVLQPDSEILKKYPDLVLKNGTGAPCIFKCEAGDCYVVDPYSPNAERYLQELFQRLKRHGFLYHKLDFVRAIILNEDVRYADPTKNRAQAYRHGIRMIRDAVGTDGYFEVCGGLYEGTAGLANAVRSGCDVRGHWEGKPTRINAYLIRIKQNVFRNHYNRFWHTDPDALQLRRRNEPFRGYEKGRHLAMGTFSNEEAFSTVVNQFLGGGLVCMAERLADFDEDRRLLYRHVVPQFAIPATPLVAEACVSCPDRFLTRFDHPGNGLDPWRIFTLANWDEEEKIHEIRLATAFPPGSESGAVALFEFREQRFLGVFENSDIIRIAVPAHGCRVLRLTSVKNHETPVLIGTDLNLSQGMELELWEAKGASVRARVNTPWNCQVTLTVLESDRKTTRKIKISPDPSDLSDKSDKSDKSDRIIRGVP